MALQDPTFENMVPGTRLGPMSVHVDSGYVRQNAFASGNYSMLGAAGAVPEQVPAAILLGDMLRLLNRVFDPNLEAGLHQRERVRLLRPIAVGETVVIDASITDRYVKRGRGYVVTQGEAVAVDTGDVLLEHTAIEVAELNTTFEQDTAPRLDLEWTKRRIEFAPTGATAPATAISPQTPPGTALEGETRAFSQAQMSVYSNVGEFWETIHTSAAAAHRAGLPSTYAQGLMLTEFACEYSARFLGDDWHRGGANETTFLRPFGADECIHLAGQVVGSETGPAAINLAFTNERDEMVAVGYSQLAPSRGDTAR
ncbi:MAG TPA: hypothetical protein VK906_15615 [Egicoccus sp.]|nr:hypothetical protein [Egicoccus sp.]HSK24613.1 hypothetical protein [Egicoccus sp.]